MEADTLELGSAWALSGEDVGISLFVRIEWGRGGPWGSGCFGTLVSLHFCTALRKVSLWAVWALAQVSSRVVLGAEPGTPPGVPPIHVRR